jgi:hypothetical protein
MLTPRLIDSLECSTIPTMIDEIDCKLAKLSGKLYNNMVFMLNMPIEASTFIDLLTYRRILQYKAVNSDYAEDFTLEMIASKVKLLKYKN